MDWSNRVALVTGAASGIGRATCLALDELGVRLVIIDIDAAGLESLAARCSRVILSKVVDVSDAEAMQSLADEVHQAVPALDLLVNNAGIGMVGTLWETPLEAWDRVLKINLYGVLHGCHAFIPNMIERGQGHIANVSSTLGFLGAARVNAYVTSKFAVLGLSESLRGELAPHGIGVSTICPGVIDTAIVDQGDCYRDGIKDDKVRDVLSDAFKKRAYPPERVAKAIVKAVERNRAVVPVSPEANALYWTKRAWPRLSAWLGGRLERQMGLDAQ